MNISVTHVIAILNNGTKCSKYIFFFKYLNVKQKLKPCNETIKNMKVA